MAFIILSTKQVFLVTKESTSLRKIQIRVGNEKITDFGQPLSHVNKLCANIEELESEEKSFNVTCEEKITGRFLSIQLLEYGQLELDHIRTYPLPGS